MDASVDPGATFALLVGIERYREGESWDLAGPAQDACRFAEWLLETGVPAEQIQLFLSPLDAERVRPPGGARTRTAVEAEIYEALTTELRPLGGDLLFLYWGGHGVLTVQESRRLYCADATEADKRNLDLNRLLTFLRSDHFQPGFPRQLAIADVCQNYVDERDLVAALPDHRFPAGWGMVEDREQFVLFAATPGHAAINSAARRAGVFSDEVLKELRGDPSGAFPPDMDALLNRLVTTFMNLREEGEVDQTPTAFSYRNWQGTWGTFADRRQEQQARRSGGDARRPRTLSLEELLLLTDTLLDTTFGERSARDRMLRYVRPQIRQRSPRSSRDRDDVMGILETCGHYSGALEELVAVVRLFDDEDSVPVQALLAILYRIFRRWR